MREHFDTLAEGVRASLTGGGDWRSIAERGRSQRSRPVKDER